MREHRKTQLVDAGLAAGPAAACAECFSELLLAGGARHVIAARVGHADPAITLRVYAHVLRE
jgi:integrase